MAGALGLDTGRMTREQINLIWIISATWFWVIATVLFYSDRFLARGWHWISEGLKIPLAFIIVAVPLTVVITFVHLNSRLIGSDAVRPADWN